MRGRARAGEVILTVEALRDIEHVVGGASGGAVVIEYAGPADGTVAGVLSTVPDRGGPVDGQRRPARSAHLHDSWTGLPVRAVSFRSDSS